MAYTTVTQRPAATTRWAATAVSASVDILEMAPTARILMNAKKKMEAAMPAPSAPTMRVGDSASVKLASAVMASDAPMLMNVPTKESAIGTPLVPTTPGLMFVPVMLAIREMGTTSVLT